MSLSQSLIDAVVDYAWSDIAKMAKKAMLDLTISQSTTINGRNLTRASMNDLKALYDMAIAQVNADGDTGGDTALVIFGEPL